MGHERTLLLITYEFPFGSGETFLEAELPIVARRFDKVIVVPSRSAWSPKEIVGPHREIPSNVHVMHTCKLKSPDFLKILVTATKIMLLSDFAQSRGRVFSRKMIAFLWTIRSSIKASIFYHFLDRLVFGTHMEVSLGYSYWMSDSALAFAILKQQNKLNNYVVRCHGGDLYDYVQPAGKKLFNLLIFSTAKAVVPISLDGVNTLRSYGLQESRIALHRLGVKLPNLVSNYKSEKKIRIVSCSNIIPVKRVDLIAKSLAHMQRPFEWFHFGDGSGLAEVKSYVSQFQDHGVAKFFGRVPNSHVLEFYKNHYIDLFINVSASEGVPVSIMEALSFGIPCIVTDVGGSAEIVDDSCGRILDKNFSENDLINAINSILKLTQSKKIKMRESARLRAELMCDANKNFSDFSDWISDTI
jgi:glycosyltransferase involved in cell wall biosynthesis